MPRAYRLFWGGIAIGLRRVGGWRRRGGSLLWKTKAPSLDPLLSSKRICPFSLSLSLLPCLVWFGGADCINKLQMHARTQPPLSLTHTSRSWRGERNSGLVTMLRFCFFKAHHKLMHNFAIIHVVVILFFIYGWLNGIDNLLCPIYLLAYKTLKFMIDLFSGMPANFIAALTYLCLLQWICPFNISRVNATFFFYFCSGRLIINSYNI